MRSPIDIIASRTTVGGDADSLREIPSREFQRLIVVKHAFGIFARSATSNLDMVKGGVAYRF